MSFNFEMTDTNIPEDTWAKLSKDGFYTPRHALLKTGSEQTENKKRGNLEEHLADLGWVYRGEYAP